MSFRNLPRPAQLLSAGMMLAGLAALSWGGVLPGAQDGVAAAFYLFLAFWVAAKRVVLHRKVATLPLGSVVVFAATLTCGAAVAMVCVILNMLAGYATPQKRQGGTPSWAVGYDASSLVVAAFLAGTVYEHLAPRGIHAAWSWQTAVAAGVALAVYFAGSTIGIGSMASITQLRLPPRKWRADLLATAPACAAGGAIALAVDAAYEALGPHGIWVFAAVLSLAVLIRWSLKKRRPGLQEHGAQPDERARADRPMADACFSIAEALSAVTDVKDPDTHEDVQRVHALAATVGEGVGVDDEELDAVKHGAAAYFSVVQALSTVIDVKDHSTHEHVQRVHALAGAVGERVGLEGEELDAVKHGAALHDIGKIAIPDLVLLKPGRLTDQEYSLIKEHPAVGEAILAPIGFLHSRQIASAVRHHHEKLDGTGYPDGLCGDEISMGARILAVLDAYDALTADRAYRKAWTKNQALAQLRQEAGTSFDPDVVEALAEVLEAEVPESGPTPESNRTLALFTERARAVASQVRASDQDLIEARAAERTRQQALRSLLQALGEPIDLLAAVAYEVDHRHHELDSVMAEGPLADAFRLVRIPAGVGPSGLCVAQGAPILGLDVQDELKCFAATVPEELREALVVATPVRNATGSVLAVVSCYTRNPDPVLDVVSSLSPAFDLIARQLEMAGFTGVMPTEREPAPMASG